MSSNKKANTFLKECMSDALIELMKSKEFAKITVNEIAGAAGVNRSTWFRNFEDKEEALTFKLVQLWLRWSKEHGLTEVYTVDNAPSFFAFNYENRDLISQIFSAGQHAAIYEAFYEVMKPSYETGVVAEYYQSRYYSHGMFGLLGEWNSRGYKETPEEMTNIFFGVVQGVKLQSY